ncbi:MAG: hypothetical protein PHE21_04085 [Candidatus Dojkabacteria bacterium]|nr:hypothetical protein [Candidatus Dojkabacteria bacterium]
MDIFTNLWNNWSNYEKITTLILVISIIIFIPISVYFFTKNKKLSILSLTSLLIIGILTIASFLFIPFIFDIHISNMFKLVPLMCLFINILNIGTMVGYYSVNRKKKDFELIDLHQECMRDTFKLSVILILLFCLSTIFLSATLLTVILTSLVVSLLTIWLNYTLLIKFVK